MWPITCVTCLDGSLIWEATLWRIRQGNLQEKAGKFQGALHSLYLDCMWQHSLIHVTGALAQQLQTARDLVESLEGWYLQIFFELFKSCNHALFAHVQAGWVGIRQHLTSWPRQSKIADILRNLRQKITLALMCQQCKSWVFFGKSATSSLTKGFQKKMTDQEQVPQDHFKYPFHSKFHFLLLHLKVTLLFAKSGWSKLLGSIEFASLILPGFWRHALRLRGWMENREEQIEARLGAVCEIEASSFETTSC